MSRRSVGLFSFLKGSTDPADGMPGCANYDHHHGGCLFGEPCKVEGCQRCGYFERSVLPTAADIGLNEVVHSQYEQRVGIVGGGLMKRGQVRKCPDCGHGVGPRQRYCPGCSKRRRRECYRRARGKRRLTRNTENANSPCIGTFRATGEAADEETVGKRPTGHSFGVGNLTVARAATRPATGRLW